MKTEIARRWTLGQSLKQIAVALGVTRGVVSGQISRMREAGLNLQKRPPSGGRKPKPKVSQQAMPKLFALQQPKKHVIKEEPAPVGSLTFLELEDWHCRYPYGERAPFAFCGKPRVEGAVMPYCEQHLDLCSTEPRWRMKL